MANANPETSSRADGDLVIALCGFISSLTTALILHGIERLTGLALYTWMLWFVIPVGALLGGMVGASGYLTGAWLFGRSPTRLLLVGVIVTSVATFLMIHFLDYLGLAVDGRRVSDYVSFPRYLDIAIRSSSISFRLNTLSVSSTGELGVFGYVPALLQVAGFAAGGFAAFSFLQRQPYCNRCSRYLRRKGVSLRYTADAVALEKSGPAVRERLEQGALGAALTMQRELGITDENLGGNLQTRIEVRECPRCGRHWARYSVCRLADEGWVEIPELAARNGSFTLAAVTTLALGVGLTTAVFSTSIRCCCSLRDKRAPA